MYVWKLAKIIQFSFKWSKTELEIKDQNSKLNKHNFPVIDQYQIPKYRFVNKIWRKSTKDNF